MAEVRIYKKPHPTDPLQRVLLTRAAVPVYTNDFYEIGEFSMTIPAQELMGYDIDIDDIVRIDNGAFEGVIDDIQMDSDVNGDIAKISGRDLRAILAQRDIVPTNYTSVDGTAGYDTRNGASETIIKGLVLDNVASPTQEGRAVANLTIAPDMGRGVQDDKYMARFNVLTDVLTDIGKDAKLGYTMQTVRKEGEPLGFLFECRVGLDRTSGQSVNSRAIFEIERGNVVAMSYHKSRRNYYNAFYTTRSGARFADEALTLLYTREGEEMPTGIDRREKWLNISVSSDVPAGEEYNELKRQAQLEMANFKETLSFTAKVNNNSDLRYMRDYREGDTVTVMRKDWGVTLTAQITRVQVSESAGSSGIVVTFGSDMPNVFKRIGTAMKELK